MSTETPAETIERLETLNHKLSTQIIGMSDRLNDSALQIATDAWDKGYKAAFNGKIDPDNNPYRQMIAEKEANR